MVRIALGAVVFLVSVLLSGVARGQVGLPEIGFAVTREGEFIAVEARVDLQVLPGMAWSVLTDYEKYPSFISTLRESKIVSRGPEGLVVDQRGSFGFLFFSQDIEARLVIQETLPTQVVARSAGGSFREMRGRYELQPFANGTRLLYSGRFLPEFRLPPIVGLGVVHYAMQKTFTEMIEEILRRDTSARRPEKPRAAGG
ncbi:MAG: SRPBCC family protein [Burkholderiales bacterium]